VKSRSAADGFALRLFDLELPYHLASVGLGGAVMGSGVRYTTVNCSSAARWVGQSVVGCRSVLRLGSLLHWHVPPVVFGPHHARRRVSPPLPAAATGYASGGSHGLASSHWGSPAAIQRLRGRRLSLSRPR